MENNPFKAIETALVQSTAATELALAQSKTAIELALTQSTEAIKLIQTQFSTNPPPNYLKILEILEAQSVAATALALAQSTAATALALAQSTAATLHALDFTIGLNENLNEDKHEKRN